MKKNLSFNLLYVALFLFFNPIILIASTFEHEAPEKSKPILEITDRFNEVKMGITEHSVYMIFTEQARNVANENFQNQFELDIHKFEDSEGNFIVSPAYFLENNIIEYHIDDIIGIKFTNGKITFVYKNKSNIGFEDIYSFDGTRALNNFYVEDLEAFIFTFTNSIKS